MPKVRLDKWLWAARFYKTRSQAVAALKAGKVDLGAQRAKPAHLVSAGAQLEIRKGPYRFDIVVCDTSERRGNAESAQKLYRETAESAQRREQTRQQIAADRAATPAGWGRGGRPTKKQRRDLMAFRDQHMAPEEIDDD